jgi:probable HAF family extracellular repeat protein
MRSRRRPALARVHVHSGARRGALGAAAVALVALAACTRSELATDPRALAPSDASHLLVGASTTDIFPTAAPGDPQTVGDARGLNAVGQVTGAAYTYAANDFQPYRWSATGGLQLLTGCCDTRWGSDINDAGVVVGTAQTSQVTGLRGFVATGTTMTSLGILPGADPELHARAIAINDAGSIVGVSVTPTYANHAVLWDPSLVIRDLGTLGGTNSIAIDINAAGVVIGTSQTGGDAATHAFAWSSGTGMQDLNATTGADITDVVEINDAGQIVGTFRTGAGDVHAFRYTPGSGLLDLGTLGGSSSTPTGLNDRGEVVGSSTLADASTHAFFWSPADGMEDLTLVANVAEVRRLNDNLQTLTGTVSPSALVTPGQSRPQLVQLQASHGGGGGEGNAAPVARFGWTCAERGRAHLCVFDASASTDDGRIVSYAWSWGNGRSETKTHATTRNTWRAAGTYEVTLTVTDDKGLTGTVSQQVAVP